MAKLILYTVAASLLISFCSANAVPQERLTVGIYYETLCPDSIRFITRQLFPVLEQVGGFGNQYFVPDFVPYGKASTSQDANGNYSFTCQHGNAECEGNKMHACALKYLPEESRAKFINCSMSASNPPTAGPACASTLGLNFTRVEQCIREDGPALLAANGNRTHSLNPTLYYVPWITYNGKFSESDLSASQSNFLQLLCDKLGSNGPTQCQPQKNNVTVSVYYETKCPDSRRFITSQLFPTFANFGGNGNPYFDIDFVPYGKANTTEGPNGTFTFVCQHGDQECEGNKMHACALKYLPEESRAKFINCSMTASNPPIVGPACAETLGLNFTRVEQCLTEDGPRLLAEQGYRTHSLNPPLYYVPWILFDGVFSENDLDQAQLNFFRVICEKLQSTNNVPSQCQSFVQQ